MSPLPGWRLVWSLYGRFWCRSSLEVLSSGARARGHVVKGHVARPAQPPTGRRDRTSQAISPALIAASFQMRGVRL